MILITIYHGKSTKRPHHTNVAQNVVIYLCFKEKLSIICADPDTLLNKTTELIPSVATEINFYWTKLRDNRHGVVFNCLLQLLYKDVEQN